MSEWGPVRLTPEVGYPPFEHGGGDQAADLVTRLADEALLLDQGLFSAAFQYNPETLNPELFST